jgi:hypothetical protein
MKTTLRWLGSIVLLCSITCAGSSRGSGSTTTENRLGQVHFKVSCAPGVQGSFDTAVALLHSFQYEEATAAFHRIAKRDPSCAMAYWGLAMSGYEQLWDFPSTAELGLGHGYVEKAQKISAKSGREREYIAAAAAFYQNDPSLSQIARTEAYSKAMAELYERHPNGVNAGAFYALSLVSLAQDGVHDLANRRRAIAILDKLFAAHPENPGVDHYLIHASDDPRLAALGLAAARNYATIAPDSAHALHMPSHIFTRLGYWQDSIHSNLASAAAAQSATRSGRDNESDYQLHALTFLEYAYLESGRDAQARHVINEIEKVPGRKAPELGDIRRLFQATYAMENHDWKMAAGLKPPPGYPYPGDRERLYWVCTVGAARSGDVSVARQDFQGLKQAHAALEPQEKGESVAEMEAEAWLENAEGHQDQALATMRAAATKEGPYGVDILGIPAEEMLGDLLLQLHHPRQALAAYQAGLKESPNRFDGLFGGARAAEAAGNASLAQSYDRKLVQSCGSGADRQAYVEAKEFLARNSG